MKDLLLIGKFNPLMQELMQKMDNKFKVQLGSDNLEIIKGMLSMNTPDIVFISLVGMDSIHLPVFTELSKFYPAIPVVCLGSESEQFNFRKFFDSKQFTVLTRPIGAEQVVERLQELLAANEKKEEAASSPDIKANKIDSLLDQIVIPDEKTILLVDDNAIQLRALRGFLKNKYKVLLATSGPEAVEIVKKKSVDVIFLDYEMPECDGCMTLEMIRKLEKGADIPVVFLTGINDKDQIKAVLSLNPADYIIKPPKEERINETLAKIFGA